MVVRRLPQARVVQPPPEFVQLTGMSGSLTIHESPQIASGAPRKRGLHQAKEDILESIEEAKYYRTAVFHASRQGLVQSSAPVSKEDVNSNN